MRSCDVDFIRYVIDGREGDAVDEMESPFQWNGPVMTDRDVDVKLWSR